MQKGKSENMKLGMFAFGDSARLTIRKILADDTLSIGFITLRKGDEDAELKQVCVDNNIPCFENVNINSKAFIGEVKTLNCDLFVSANYNQIFKTEIINIPKLKTINCHTGMLPFYRGMNALNWTIINGEQEYGITTHMVDEGIDTGDIVHQGKYAIGFYDTYKDIIDQTYSRYADVLYTGIKQLQDGSANIVKQIDIHPTGFYCGARTIGDEVVDWNQSAIDVHNFIRGLYFPPAITAIAYLGDTVVRINKAAPVEGVPTYKGIPGQVIGKTDRGVIVKTGDSVIEVYDYEASVKLKIGDRLKSVAI